MRDDFTVVGGAKLCARLPRELFGIAAIEVGNRDKPDSRMLGGKPRAQRADAAGPDDRDAELFAFDDVSSVRITQR